MILKVMFQRIGVWTWWRIKIIGILWSTVWNDHLLRRSCILNLFPIDRSYDCLESLFIGKGWWIRGCQQSEEICDERRRVQQEKEHVQSFQTTKNRRKEKSICFFTNFVMLQGNARRKQIHTGLCPRHPHQWSLRSLSWRTKRNSTMDWRVWESIYFAAWLLGIFVEKSVSDEIGWRWIRWTCWKEWWFFEWKEVFWMQESLWWICERRERERYSTLFLLLFLVGDFPPDDFDSDFEDDDEI